MHILTVGLLTQIITMILILTGGQRFLPPLIKKAEKNVWVVTLRAIEPYE